MLITSSTKNVLQYLSEFYPVGCENKHYKFHLKCQCLEKCSIGQNVKAHLFGWNLAQKLGVMRYFKSHFGSLL